MTKSNNEWVPEVGDAFEVRWFGCYNDNWIPFTKTVAKTDEYIIGLNTKGREAALPLDNVFVTYRPIKTEAEKRRESQINMMNDFIGGIPDHEYYDGEVLYENNFRILSENQFIAINPSIDQIQAELYKAEQEGRSMTWVDGLHAGLIKAAHIMGGEL